MKTDKSRLLSNGGVVAEWNALPMDCRIAVEGSRARGQAVLEAQITQSIPRWKRVLDIALILVSAPFVVPVAGLLALFIKMVSPGPVFFSQERIGHGCKPFRCFKFRSMRVNADATAHQDLLARLMSGDIPMTKMDTQDRRLIPFGKLLRASGLDELAQLWNVLRGEMSWVGPRPCTRYEFELYLPWQKERFTTLPGLTGLWQVSGKNRTTFQEMMELDIQYARNLSFFSDCKIILKTIPALLTQVAEAKASSASPPTKRTNGEKPTNATREYEQTTENRSRRMRLLGT